MRIIAQVKKLQVFGKQADDPDSYREWSFVQHKERKRWIWVADDPVSRLVITHHIGGRGDKAARKFWKKISSQLRTCNFETDDWKAYRKIILPSQHKVGKDLTFYIEGFNATIFCCPVFLLPGCFPDLGGLSGRFFGLLRGEFPVFFNQEKVLQMFRSQSRSVSNWV
jgi:IS1 family transposase